MAISANIIALGTLGFLNESTGGGIGYPSEDDVENGVIFGNANEYTGNFVAPAITNVLTAIGYGANGTEFIGTLVIPGAQNAPSSVILTAGSAIRYLLVNDSDVYSLVGNQVFPTSAPETAVLPYAVYQEIDRNRERHMNLTSGLVRVRVQIDWYARDRDLLTNLMEFARLAVDVYQGTIGISTESINVKDISMQDEFDGWEPIDDGSGNPIYRGTQDYFVWHGETIPTR